MVSVITESVVEEACLDILESLGYSIKHKMDPDEPDAERISHGDVTLKARLRDALIKINPHLSQNSVDDALRAFYKSESNDLIEENRRIHRLIVEGINIEVTRDDGSVGGEIVNLIDFDNPENNDWLAVNQFRVIENKHNRVPDVIIFINGLPVVVMELKNPADESATITDAFNQLQTYKAEITSLFHTNAFLITSDGILARIGSLTANEERFMPWRSVNGDDIAGKGTLEMETLINGICNKENLLSLIKSFTVFENDGLKPVKKIAGYHQFFAVKKAIEKTVSATSESGDRKIGVMWHTQGSGKSLLMAFYAGQAILHPKMANPTIVVLTDRNDLDDQLFGTFSGCSDLIRQAPSQAESRSDLKELLSVSSGGVIFTTIQKFTLEKGETEYPVLTDRKNIVVIVDEAHRSQYGFKSNLDRKTGDVSYGFAKYLRDALPNASFIGFTATPIEHTDVNTPAVFGDYIDTYDINRGIEDGATVPIYYESRLAKLDLDETIAETIDEEVEEILEGEELEESEKLKGRWAKVEGVVGAEKRIKEVAQDLVNHFEDRLRGMDGKGMIVCMSRRICITLYNEIVKLKPEWDDEDDNKGVIKIVMTGSASDPLDWQKHIGNKSRRELLAKRAKDPDDELKLVIVRDMWLTGFDSPSLHTMYVDKPMKSHGLMQSIARVNRVFKDKPGGLIVDYIGIAQNLKSAIANYSANDKKQAGIDQGTAIQVMLEKYEVVKDFFHGFNDLNKIKGSPQERMSLLASSMEWVLEKQRLESEKKESAEEKKAAHKRYSDIVLALSKAFALAAATEEAKNIRDEVGFFQAVRSALVKSSSSVKLTPQEQNIAVQQLISKAVISTEIVDILAVSGFQSQDISILSDQFLADVAGLKQKNLAVEALRKLINGEISSRLAQRIVQAKAFSERLNEAINRYHNNDITTVEILEELIALAKEVSLKIQEGDTEGITEDERSFYEALAENESALEVMGDEKLKIIAQELLISVKNNATIDWNHSEIARAKIRVLVKRILKKFGYPPDLQDRAVQTVIQQAEALTSSWMNS